MSFFISLKFSNGKDRIFSGKSKVESAEFRMQSVKCGNGIWKGVSTQNSAFRIQHSMLVALSGLEFIQSIYAW